MGAGDGQSGQQGSAPAGEGSQAKPTKLEDMDLQQQVEHLRKLVSRPKWCAFYLKGTCTKGTECDFAHIEQDAVDKMVSSRDKAMAKRTPSRRRRDGQAEG